MTTHYQKASFLLSVADIKQLPPDEGYEVAIVGRSNAGKSSALNQITHSKRLARVSKTPGRTQLINIFTLDETRRLVDLPGYGFAKAPLAAKAKWEQTINDYFTHRTILRGLILVMDIRHPLKPLDWQLLEYCASRDLPVHILLNKSDKLSKGAANNTLQAVQKALREEEVSATCQLFSALNGTGIQALHKLLDNWYDY